MGQLIFENNNIRLRIIDLQYQNLDEDKFEQEIKRIYLEETGTTLDANIDIVHSDTLSESNGSSYDGTAVNLHSDDGSINEVYVISQGSADAGDWDYNLRGIFAGQEVNQYESTYAFVNESKKYFEQKNNLPEPAVIGLSHSLAHHNNSSVQLVTGVFDEVYSVNGAQPTAYHLYKADVKFRQAINREFSIGANPDDLFSVSPEKLKVFTENYYQDMTTGIHQLISEDDPLYAGSGARGFFTVGDVTMVDTNPEMSGLRSMVDSVPDDVIADFQQLAVQYSLAFEKGGSPRGIQDLTGVNISVIDKFAEDPSFVGIIKNYFTSSKDLDDMIVNMNEKIPVLLETVESITKNGEQIFGAFVTNGFITEAEKNILVSEMDTAGGKLDEMMEILNTLSIYRDGELAGNTGTAIFGADASGALRLKGLMEDLTKSGDEFSRILGPVLEEIGHSHSIEEMLNALGMANGRQYQGNDMIMIGQQDGSEIRVNISAAVRMYQEGQALLGEKRSAVEAIMTTYQTELLDGFEEEKAKVIARINEIESNPVSYTNVLRKYVYFPRLNKSITRITIHDSFQPLSGVSFDDLYSNLLTTIQSTDDFLTSSREAIEKIFEKDEHVAQLFDFGQGGEKVALR